MDRDVPVAGTTTLESYVTNAMAQTRFLLALISTFAVLAIVLASLGLYGVISYSARQRTREILPARGIASTNEFVQVGLE